jgi:hypothetical protein
MAVEAQISNKYLTQYQGRAVQSVAVLSSSSCVQKRCDQHDTLEQLLVHVLHTQLYVHGAIKPRVLHTQKSQQWLVYDCTI